MDSAPVFQRSGTSDSFDEFTKFGNENIHDGNYDEDENQDLGFDQEQEHCFFFFFFFLKKKKIK